ncbi:MAG: penicillin-binding protein 2 [Endomicrobiales bacterium]|jgi:cell division protein FtsI (penicillin-binding protein 3)
MISRNRTVFPFLLILTAFGIIGTRLFFVQIWHHDEISRQVMRIVRRDRPETTCRGMIVDRCGRILAVSVKAYTLFIDPSRVKNIFGIISSLRRFSITIPSDIVARNPHSAFIPVAHDLDSTTMQSIKALDLTGVGFNENYRREYPEGRLGCHVLGVVGQDGSGLEGVELTSNGYLSGEKIRLLRYRDGRGREITDKLVDLEQLSGANVTLTIDRNLQFIAEQEVERAWKDARAKKAMVIIEDPRSGEILALACRPDYDPADFGTSVSALRNPAICDMFEPGSTFKLVTISAALEEKVVKRNEMIWCENGAYAIKGHTIGDHEKKGLISVDEVLEYSSNIGTAKIGMRLGKDNLYRYIRQFGFNAKTGIDLPGEAKGLLQLPQQWSGLSLPIISFGQEIGVTALQVINAYSSIANGGFLLEPKVIKEIKTPQGRVLYACDKRIIRQTVSPAVADSMREMLVDVVEKGTGKMAKVPGYSVGGKTGTAQKRDPRTGKYSTTSYVASFCGIIPMRDPKLAVLVVIDEPQGDYYGGSQSAPVFSRIASRAVRYLQIAPDEAVEPMRKI